MNKSISSGGSTCSHPASFCTIRFHDIAPERSGRTFLVESLSKFRRDRMSLAVGETVGMGTPRETTEKQLSQLQAALDQHTAKLKSTGKTDADLPNDTKWRHLSADASQIRARLVKISEVEANNVEVARLKAEREAPAS